MPLNTLPALNGSPDMVDDLFLLALRALGYAPRLLLTPDARALSMLLDVAMVGCVIQHREANGSVLGFLARLTNPRTLDRCPAGAGAVLRQHFVPRAPLLVRLLLSGVAGTLPAGRVPDVSAALVGVLASAPSGPQEGLGWLMTALQAIPDLVATPADKQALYNAAATALSLPPPPQRPASSPSSAAAGGPSGAGAADASAGGGEDDGMGNGNGGAHAPPPVLVDPAWSHACDEFAELCRRNKRTRQAAQAALLPAELAEAVDLGERKRGGAGR